VFCSQHYLLFEIQRPMDSIDDDRPTDVCSSPEMVEEVSAHLMAEGMIDSHAIPTYTITEEPKSIGVIDASTAGTDGACDNASLVSVAAQPIEAHESRPEFVSATFIKKTPDERLGVCLGDDLGDIYISSLDADSIVHQSPLRVGDKLLSINRKSCLGMSHNDAIDRLQQATETLTIITHNVGGSSKQIETMVEKPTPTTMVGIRLKRNAHGSLVICKIVPTGLFSHSLLNVKDRVLSINGIESRRLDPKSAVKIISNAPRFVTMLTETQRSAGVVVAATSHHLQCATIEEDRGPERAPVALRKRALRRSAVAVAVVVVVSVLFVLAFWT